MRDVMIRVEHVEKEFNKELVLKDVTHDFEAGKIHGIVGNNGSGKTVLFKCICGFLTPDRGKIWVDYEQWAWMWILPALVGRLYSRRDFFGIVPVLKILSCWRI